MLRDYSWLEHTLMFLKIDVEIEKIRTAKRYDAAPYLKLFMETRRDDEAAVSALQAGDIGGTRWKRVNRPPV